MRPSDHCPYSRPFPAGFAECPAFQPVRFIPMSSNYQPLEPAITCRHLTSRLVPGEGSRWYPACQLGDGEARIAWVQAVEPARLSAIARLRFEMAGLNALFIDELWRLKAQQLAARRTYGNDGDVRRRMVQVCAQFLAQTQGFLDSHRSTLEEIEVTADALLHLLRLSIEQFIARSTGEVRWEIPAEALARFSPQVQLFFRPPSAVPSPTPAE